MHNNEDYMIDFAMGLPQVLTVEKISEEAQATCKSKAESNLDKMKELEAPLAENKKLESELCEKQ